MEAGREEVKTEIFPYEEQDYEIKVTKDANKYYVNTELKGSRKNMLEYNIKVYLSGDIKYYSGESGLNKLIETVKNDIIKKIGGFYHDHN